MYRVLLVMVALTSSCQRPSSPSEAVMTTAVTVDVYSDIICPFCFIGTERLDKAIDDAGLTGKVALRHRPFLLSPDTPEEGANIDEYLRQRTGGRDPRIMQAPVEQMAKDSGLDLDLSKQKNNYPTLAAHALLLAAEPKGTMRALEKALFHAHFKSAENISDRRVLTRLATAHGFTADEVAAVLDDATTIAQVRAQAEQAARDGVRGVPLFVIAGVRDGDRPVVISGAQSEAVLAAALRDAASP